MVCARRSAVVLLAVVCGCAAWGGCASSRPAPETPESGLPAWVLAVAPITEDGRANYVGSCSIAVDAESGLAEAEHDARLQIEDEARGRFLDIYELGRREILKEATPAQRFDLQNLGCAIFLSEMISSARADASYYRRCGDVAERGGGSAPAPGPVCQIFVLVSVDMNDWDRRAVRLLGKLRTEVAVAPDKTLARMTDLLIREYESMILAKQGEEDGAGDAPARSSRQR